MSQPEEKCDCPACTGMYTPYHLELTRASVKEGLAKGKLIYNHLHGDNGQLFTPVGISALTSVVLGNKVPNLMIEVLDMEIQFGIVNALIHAFKTDAIVLANHMQIESEHCHLSVPIRLNKVDPARLPSHLTNFMDVAYENHPREDLYQVIFPDSAGLFPDQFGFNHAQMHWNKPLGDL